MPKKSEDAVRRAAELALEHIRSEETTPVRPYRAPDAAYDDLDIAICADGLPFDDVVEKLRRLLAETPTTSSKRFFNQLFAGRDAVATMADMLVAVANISMYTWKVAGPQILVEREVIERLAGYVGFERGEGMFCPGGSLSNMVAMIVARNEAIADAREHGLPGDRLMVYSSAESHYSIMKAAGMVGVGRANVRKIACDREGRMDPAALDRAIRDDLRSGARPVFINATAGTTVEGAFDPIREIAAVAREHGVWLHVDGAYGGAVLLSRKRRHLLDGCELA
ncbi:MAG: pyridoxal phosphate-dependent decarboxylase family protein, partial [Phycisphaerales bacterium]